MKITYFKWKTIILEIVTENEIIKGMEFVSEYKNSKDNDFELRVKQALGDYFEGKRTEFDFTLEIEGTDFQRKVWEEMAKIPYGKTMTYGELAIKVGSPKGARAVGMACNKNKIPIIIPCHRVVGANGKLTGFAGGLDVKEILLKIEGEKNDN